jgi:Ca2+/H+ antiporter, TMEM165/GDT1 family
MDALLLSFLLCLIAESGGRAPLLARALYQRYEDSPGVTAGATLGLGASAVIAAVAGGMIGARLTPEARTLFFACALGAAGVGLLFVRRRIDRPVGGKPGAFFTSALSLFILDLGESAPFLIAGIAASRADPWMAGAGGWLGGMTACLLLARITKTGPSLTGVNALRIGAGIMLLLSGFIVAMSALRLL